jgi:hypothetical protein
VSESNDKLKDAIEFMDLGGWLDTYVATKHGGGSELRLETCPNCANSEYRLYVNTDTKVWICYVCDWGRYQGDVTVLMAMISGRNLFDIRKELLQSVKPAPVGDLQQLLMSRFQQAPKPLAELTPSTGIQLPGSDGWGGITSQKVWNYLIGRGLTDEEIVMYRFRTALKLRGFTGPFAVSPVFYKDQPVNWQGRRIEGDFDPKYVSYDDIANWLWPIDQLQNSLLARAQQAFLVEGVYDAAGMRRIGQPGLSTFGKKISERQIQLLIELGVREVYLCWDADSARTSDKRIQSALKDPKVRVGMRGEIEQAALRCKRYFNTKVVDLSNAPPLLSPNGERIKKPDPGEILRAPSVADWVLSRINKAMPVDSLEFFEWRLS